MNASFELLNDDEEDTMGEDDLGFFFRRAVWSI